MSDSGRYHAPMAAEADAGTFKDHFSGHAEDYARYRPRYPEALADLLAGLSPARALALDCGCGSGQLAVLLGSRFERVIAVDASARQIASAFPHPHVEYHVAPADRTPLPDASADLIVAAQAVHWFDLPAFWREVYRVGRPGTLMALAGYAPMSITPAVDAVVHWFRHVRLRPFWPSERQMVEERYTGIDFPFDEVPAPEIQMTACWTMPQLLRYLATWSGIEAAERTSGQSPLADLRSRLQPAWGDAERPHLVRWPLFLRLGYVRPQP